MNQRKRIVIILSLLIMIPVLAWTLDTGIVLEAAGLGDSQPPLRYVDQILFSYSFGSPVGDTRIHTVGVAFHHENYRTVYPYRRNEQGVYVLLYRPPVDTEELLYRVVVDGIWTTDPTNPDSVVDRWGVKLSRLMTPRATRSLTQTPVIYSDGSVEFVVDASPGSRVVVVGSFNGWDPYVTPLTETQPGVFSRRLRMVPGDYLYYFWIDGVRYADPKNPEQRWHNAGMTLSAVHVP